MPGLTKRMMFADISVSAFIRGYGATDGGRQEPPRFIAATAAHDAEGDSTGTDSFDPLGLCNDPATRRQNARYLNQVALFNTGIAEREFERVELFAVPAHSLGQKKPFGNVIHRGLPPLGLMIADIGSGRQFAPKVLADNHFRGFRRSAGDHMDAFAEKQFLRSRAHAAGNDHISPLFVQPLG